MANLVPITDPTDERLDDYVRLRETSLRRKLETDGGLFVRLDDLLNALGA